MAVAYVDTSCLVAIAFGERGGSAMRRRLSEFGELVSSNLLEAELRSAFGRERVELHASLLSSVGWIIPDRPLSHEVERVLETGYLRGGDCWHLATALYLAGKPESLVFLTLDDSQRRVARSLGFGA